MKDKVKIALIVGLAVVLLTCIYASVMTGQVPVPTGLLITTLVAGGLSSLIISKYKPASPAPAVQPGSEQPEPISGSLLSDRYRRALREADIEIPENPAQLQMPVHLLPGCNVNLIYYCWKTSTHMVMFPRWDNLETTLDLLGYIENGFTTESVRMDCFKIPLSSITCFVKEPFYPNIRPLTVLHYRNSMGDNVGLIMQEDAHSTLKSLIPTYDLGIIEIQRYPQSSRQVFDIAQKLEQLKALHTQALIDEEEYAAKKHQLLTTL